jgi:hypothetical protein
LGGGLDPAVELQKIYDSEINVRLNWMWDGGVSFNCLRCGKFVEVKPPAIQ